MVFQNIQEQFLFETAPFFDSTAEKQKEARFVPGLEKRMKTAG